MRYFHFQFIPNNACHKYEIFLLLLSEKNDNLKSLDEF